MHVLEGADELHWVQLIPPTSPSVEDPIVCTNTLIIYHIVISIIGTIHWYHYYYHLSIRTIFVRFSGNH